MATIYATESLEFSGLILGSGCRSSATITNTLKSQCLVYVIGTPLIYRQTQNCA